jgi:crotonobetainyl-CoA:carnitine CoA-transferase CaiB-like acyl-CoA transferase
MAEGPLSGVRVVELCSWFTGPMAACILADQGAEVIKIEPAGGDPFRRTGTSRNGHSAFFMAANRNKRSVILDLKQPDHREALLAMIGQADVFIQNFKPGVAERLGVGADDLRSAFPRLIYASVAGYGQTGPNAREGAFDTMIQAISGLPHIQRDRASGRPQLVRTLVADKIASPIVAQAITSALYQRERTGQGCTVDFSMLDGMVWWMWPDAMMNLTFLGDGVEAGVDIAEVDLICETADGYLVATAHQQTEWEAFVELVGRPELNDDPRLATERARGRNLDHFTAVLRESFGGRTTGEWIALLRERGIPCAPVLRPDEAVTHPQVVWNKLIEEGEHPEAGRHRSVRGPVRFDGESGGIYRPAPAAGADTAEVLDEYGIRLGAKS